MKIQYASDLHLEFSQNTNFLQEIPLIVSGDILLLAGDISYLGDRRLNRHRFWDWASDHYEKVYVLPGNHEFYGGYDLSNTLDGFELKIRPNVCWVNNRVIREESVDFIFTTLWSPVPAARLMEVEYGMMDCQRIRYLGRRFAAIDYDEVFGKCFRFLKHALETSEARQKVVITHHVPTNRCNPEKYRGSVLNDAFVVELEDFISGEAVDYWIYGHSHANMPLVDINGTKIVSNQLGYVKYDEHLSFRLDASIELD